MALPPSPAPLLRTRDLTKSFGRLTALKGHAITVNAGEIVGVIGPNGSGKSTFFNVVTGFQRADSGVVELDGTPIQHLPAARIARAGIARTFQGTRLFAHLTVRENVAAAAQLRHRTTLLDALLGTPRLGRTTAAVAAATERLLALVDLHTQAGRRAGDLPYGDQRRLELVRALATGPRLLMLDEPAAGMDASETRRLLELIRRIRDGYGVGIIVVIFEGSPAEVQDNARVREVYLGPS